MEGTHSMNQFGEFHFAFGGRAETGSDGENLAQRIDHRRKAVAQDQRAPGENIIDVLVAIDVEDVRSLAAGDEGRRAANAAKCADGGIDAAGDQLLGAGE